MSVKLAATCVVFLAGRLCCEAGNEKATVREHGRALGASSDGDSGGADGKRVEAALLQDKGRPTSLVPGGLILL